MSFIYDSHGDPRIVPARPTVIHFRPTRGGAMSFVTVLFPRGLIVNGIRVFEKDGKRSVSPPVQTYERRGGGAAYKWILEFSTAEQQEEFQREVLEAVDRFSGQEVEHAE